VTAVETHPHPLARTASVSDIVEPAAYKLARLAPHYDGIDFLEAIRRGELPPAPIAELLGFEIRDLRPGQVSFAMQPDERHYNPIGSVHGGVAATLLDTVMGCALHTRLTQGVAYTTLDISVRYLKPMTVQTHTVLATGTVVHLGRRTATAEARLVQEETGSLLATSTSTLLLIRP
jgi:uncharacterized protein (TIGR00369 family)